MATRMQQRRGTAAQWAATNPILSSGEVGFETDTLIFKIGNGTSAWNVLPTNYISKRGGDTIVASGPAVVPLTVQSAVGQTADIAVIKNGAGTVIGRIASTGVFYRGTSIMPTVAENDLVYIRKDLADAKGDLIVASAADIVTRLALGTSGQALVVDTADALGVKWGSPVAKPNQVDVFTSSGNWSLPLGAKLVTVYLSGGGGGGGGGGSMIGSTGVSGGGGGGGGGSVLIVTYEADALASVVPVVVGAGGAGGAGANATGATLNVGSSNGSGGGSSTFKGSFSAGGVSAGGGAGATGGGSLSSAGSDTTATNGGGGAAGTSVVDAMTNIALAGNNGGFGRGFSTSSVDAPILAGANAYSRMGAGGGGGGRGTSSTAPPAAGIGGSSSLNVIGGAAGVHGTSLPVAGMAGPLTGGSGGGGGHTSQATAAVPQNGAAGGFHGGGGGGGGGRSYNTGTTSGATGGAGGAGAVVIVTYF